MQFFSVCVKLLKLNVDLCKMKIQKNKIYVLIDSVDKEASEGFSNICNFLGDEIIKGKLVDKAVLGRLSANDVLVVENVLSLGASLSEILDVLAACAKSNIHLCLVREGISLSADALSKVASSLLLADKLNKSLISLRSHAAIQRKIAKGHHFGRPFKSTSAKKLDIHQDDVRMLLKSGMSKDKIAEKFNVCRSTVYNFIKKHPELAEEVSL